MPLQGIISGRLLFATDRLPRWGIASIANKMMLLIAPIGDNTG